MPEKFRKRISDQFPAGFQTISRCPTTVFSVSGAYRSVRLHSNEWDPDIRFGCSGNWCRSRVGTGAEMKCTVHAVVVPPMQRGTAYAHATSGRCIALKGDRSTMMALCDEVRLYNSGGRGRVVVDTNDWQEAVYLEHSACFAHLGFAA